jgi:aminopeptidase N
MENKPIAQMHPEWNIDQLVANSKNSTLDLDAQPTTRAIRAKADTPDQINQMFDGIAYGKASDVLLTVENYVGPEVFRKGVHEYLEAHLYGNATAEDFWNAQTRVSHKPIDKIMDSLVAQPGVPILTFGEPHDGQVSVEQHRFFLSPNMESDPSQKWTLPVCFKTDTGQADCQVLTPETSTLKVPASKLFFPDAGGKGYYRTAYPSDIRTSIVANIETALTPPERIGFTGDQWAQMRSNKLTVGDYLDLAAALKSDPNAQVFSVAVGGVDAIVERIAVTPEQRAAMAAWIRRTYSPELKKLGPPLPSDTPNKDHLRTLLFEVLGEYGEDPEVLSQAGKIAEEYIADPASADPTLGQAALYIAAMHGDAKLFDKLQHVYETSSDPVMRETALHLLGMFEDPRLIRRSLDYAISGKVRNQDAAIQLSVSLGMPASRDIAWDYIKSHWDSVKAQMTTELGSYLVGATASFCSVEKRDDVQDFFSTHELAATSRALKHAVERINGCVEFRKLQEPNLNRWLAAQANP